MPEIDDGVTVMASPWDRTGGNADCCDYEDVRGDTNVLLDVDGPGCIHRLFTGVLGPWVEGTRIQIFLDHASTPTFDRPVSEFFSEQGGAFPPPLMAVRTYAGTHFPIPYARHARVQLVSDAQRWGGYWQITYTTYPTGTPVETLRWPLNDDERGELERVVSSWSLATWAEAPLPAELEALRRTIDLAPGSSARVDLRGPGVLRELRVALPRALMNDVTLQVRWDGASEPAMSLGLADHFAV